MSCVYFIECLCAETPIKIGHATNLASRLSGISTGSPFELRVIGKLECGPSHVARRVERLLHDRLSSFHIRGEWFAGAVRAHVLRVLEIAAAKTRLETESGVIERSADEWAHGLAVVPFQRSQRAIDGAQRAAAKRAKRPWRWVRPATTETNLHAKLK